MMLNRIHNNKNKKRNLIDQQNQNNLKEPKILNKTKWLTAD